MHDKRTRQLEIIGTTIASSGNSSRCAEAADLRIGPGNWMNEMAW